MKEIFTPTFFRIAIITLILVLIAIILAQAQCNGKEEKPTVVTTIDTVWQYKTDTLIKKVTAYKTIYQKIPDNLKPSENCDSLKAQYLKVAKQYIAKNIYKDTIKIDDIGNIIIADTTQYNLLRPRTIFRNYKIPTITETTTITKSAPRKTQLYFGPEMVANQYQFNNAGAGILLKTKGDQIYKGFIGLNNEGQAVYGAGFYIKIKLKK